jgi:hypothetical protein
MFRNTLVALGILALTAGTAFAAENVKKGLLLAPTRK